MTSRRWSRLGALLPLAACAAAAAPAHGATLTKAYTLSGSTASNLVEFDPNAPAAATKTTAIAGLTAGEELAGIDGRPATGQLYALGVNPTTNTATLYVVNTSTGGLTAVGGPSAIALTTNGTTAVALPNPATTRYGFDFNPAADRIRVTAGALNFRVNPITGAAVDGNNTGNPSPAVTGTNPDGNINAGATTVVDEVAYTNNTAASPVTTLFTLAPFNNFLSIQNPPNAGTQTERKGVTLGGVPLLIGSVLGFDIEPGIGAATDNAAPAAGSGLAIINNLGDAALYSVSLVDASAIKLGNIAAGGLPLRGLAFAIPAPATGGGGGGGSNPPVIPPVTPPKKDTTRPTVSKVGVKAAKKRKLTITFTASEAGTAKIRVLREVKGRRRGKACSTKAKRGKRCTIRRSYGTITRKVTGAGKVTVSVNGKVGSRKLAIGKVRVEVRFTDLAGNTLTKTVVRSGTVRK